MYVYLGLVKMVTLDKHYVEFWGIIKVPCGIFKCDLDLSKITHLYLWKKNYFKGDSLLKSAVVGLCT